VVGVRCEILVRSSALRWRRATGYFRAALRKDNAKIQTQQFTSGTDAIQALLSGSIDASYIGPSPTITAYAQTQGQAVRVICGVTSGGASLVVKRSIKSVEDLRGAKMGTPGLGNTQDVALRYFLKQHGLRTTEAGGGDVSVLPQDSNGTAVQAFQSGTLDGAWLPEPYATQMVQQGHGVRLVNEKML
jgi:NitT/TauT family transport system substrate-binding protein